MIKQKKYILTVFFIFMVIASCGYRFAGSGSLPAGINSIFIEIFDNRTSETGAENVFTNDLIYEITRNSKVKITDKHGADASISGVIKSMAVETISRREIYSALEKRVKVNVDITLTRSDGRILWAAKDLSANETFDILEDSLATEQNRRDAVSKLSKRLAEDIYNRMTDDF